VLIFEVAKFVKSVQSCLIEENLGLIEIL